jgi:2-phosphosulfolactate phosphatase
VTDVFGQAGFQVRLDWGLEGARAVAADVSVVVDVLSFSTAVCICVGRGTTVFPCPWTGEEARALADARDAVLAVGRGRDLRVRGAASPGLSPAGLVTGPAVARLVLPSPNGSSICFALHDDGAAVAAGCLRNAAAVATWLGPALRAGQTVAVVAAGERWGHDGSLRPALEDHLGAGAVVSHLRTAGLGGSMSPEASAAADLFLATREHLSQRVRDCVSGRELVHRDFGDDVVVATELDVSEAVPVLVRGAFVNAAGARH